MRNDGNEGGSLKPQREKGESKSLADGDRKVPDQI